MVEEITISQRMDQLEAELLKRPKVDCPLQHLFTKGLYSRTIFMPAGEYGTYVTSRIHRTQHQFLISKGTVLVKVNDEQWERLEAPFLGITQPGTRRILFVESDCIWTTFHPTEVLPEDDSPEALLKAVEQVEMAIIEPHVNELLCGELKNNIIIKKIDNQ